MTNKHSMRLFAAFVLAFCMPWSVSFAVSAGSPVEGVWLTLLKSEITVLPCPEGYCGYITKIVVPEEIVADNAEVLAGMNTEDFVDHNNKDPEMRGRPILGLKILTLRQGKEAHIFDGEIYNPQDGNTYSGYVEVKSSDALRLNGCVLFNVICRGEDWVRIATPEEIAPPASGEAIVPIVQ